MDTKISNEFRPQAYTRIGGILYLIIIVAGIYGELFVRGKLVISGDPMATANNIMASELLWRIGIVGDILMHVCDVPLMMIFYVLLKPVNKNIALLGVLLNLVQTAVMVAYKLNLYNALFLLGSSDYLKVFDTHQLSTMAYLAIKSDGYGFGVGLIFFGFACLIYGFLILKSGYLPKIIGIMMQVAGLCYIANNLLLLLVPAYANTLFLLPAFFGELSLCLWMIFKGVNPVQWDKRSTLVS